MTSRVINESGRDELPTFKAAQVPVMITEQQREIDQILAKFNTVWLVDLANEKAEKDGSGI